MNSQTPEIAFLIPSHAGTMTPCHNQVALSPIHPRAVVMASNTGLMMVFHANSMAELIPEKTGSITPCHNHIAAVSTNLQAATRRSQ